MKAVIPKRLRIGMLGIQLAPHYRAVVLAALQATRQRLGNKVLFHFDNTIEPLGNRSREWLMQQRCDCVIAPFEKNDGFAQLVIEAGLPSLNIAGVLKDSRLNRVQSDDHRVGQLAAEHLASLPYNSYLSMHLGHQSHALWQRGDAFAKKIHDLTGTEAHVLKFWDEPKLSRLLKEAALTLPIGIFCPTGNSAAGAIEMLAGLGIDCPAYAGVVGVGNDPLFLEGARVPLTSVLLDYAKFGEACADWIEAVSVNRDLPWHGDRLISPAGLIEGASTGMPASDDPVVTQALAMLHGEFTSVPSIAELARRCGVSERSLHQRLTRATGKSGKEILTRERMRLACRLLLSGQHTVAEVGYACGYESAPHFSRAFKTFSGSTPATYRERFGGAHIHNHPEKRRSVQF